MGNYVGEPEMKIVVDELNILFRARNVNYCANAIGAVICVKDLGDGGAPVSITDTNSRKFIDSLNRHIAEQRVIKGTKSFVSK